MNDWFSWFARPRENPKPIVPQKDITAYEVISLLVAVDPPLRFNEKVLGMMPDNVRRHVRFPPSLGEKP